MSSVHAEHDLAQARLRVATTDAAAEYLVLPHVETLNAIPELEITATIATEPNGQARELHWQLRNTSPQTISDVSLYPVIDVDIAPAADTFFDEHAAVSALGVQAATGQAVDAWDFGELGYWHGDLLARIRADELNSPPTTVGADDQSLVWRFRQMNWYPGTVADLVVRVSASETTGLYVENGDGQRVYVEASLSVQLPANHNPTVQIASTVGGDVALGSTITLSASADDPDGQIAQVEFFANGESIGVIAGSGPFTLDYVADEAGSVTLTVVATDDRGGTTTSEPIVITVLAANSLPTVSIDAPISGSTVTQGDALVVHASASDDDGFITEVEFFANEQSIGVVTGAGPYALSHVAEDTGILSFSALARDDRGGTATSTSVSVTVLAENIAPSVALLAPVDGSSVDQGSVLTLSATAQDSDGSVTQVEFYANGQSIGVISGAGPYELGFNADQTGTLSFTAVASDDRDAHTSSTPVNVHVLAPNVTPSIAIVSPSSGSEVEQGTTVTLTADARDSDGDITQVEFFANGVSLGVVAGAGPHALSYVADTLGTVEFTAVATDNRNGHASSAAVTVSVFAPSTFEAFTEMTRDHRVLVLMSCDVPTSPQTENACITERARFLHQLLDSRGIAHRIVYTDADFLAALRCGDYNSYWISGGVAKLSANSIDEIGGNLLHGHALLVDARHDERNHGLDQYLGAQSTGHLGTALPDMSWTMAGRTFGFADVAAGRRTMLSGAEVLGRFDSVDHDPAVLRHRVIDGRSLWLGFDWVGAAMRLPRLVDLGEHADALFTAVPTSLPSTLVPGSTIGLSTLIRHDADDEQTYTVTATWPDALAYAGGLDEPQSQTAGSAEWRVTVPAQTDVRLDWRLRLPTQAGSFRVDVVISDSRGLTQTHAILINTESANNRLVTARSVLQSLALNGQDAAKRMLAVRALNDAITALTADQLDAARSKTLEAILRTREIRASGTEPAQRESGLGLREIEYRLCDASLAQCPTAGAAGTHATVSSLPNAGFALARRQGQMLAMLGDQLAAAAALPLTAVADQDYRILFTRQTDDRLRVRLIDAHGQSVYDQTSVQALIFGNTMAIDVGGVGGAPSLALTRIDQQAFSTSSTPIGNGLFWWVPNWTELEGVLRWQNGGESLEQDFTLTWQSSELLCRTAQ